MQVARQRTNEEFGWVAGQRKVARVDSVRELAEWGGKRRKRTDLQHAV